MKEISQNILLSGMDMAAFGHRNRVRKFRLIRAGKSVRPIRYILMRLSVSVS